jgi:hypothetical protein
MMATFYKQEPTVDTEYRQLILECENDEWAVRLSGGKKWGPKSKKLKVIPATSFDDGKLSYDKIYGQLLGEGWKAYSPQQTW